MVFNGDFKNSNKISYLRKYCKIKIKLSWVDRMKIQQTWKLCKDAILDLHYYIMLLNFQNIPVIFQF